MGRIVCIIGSTRSGSTMLDLIISSHPNVASLGELCLLNKRECGYCGDVCEYWKQYRQEFNGKYYKTAFNVFKKNTLVDSSKKWRWFKERFKYEKYDYKVIHLVRNGLDRLKFKKKKEGKIEPYVVKGWVRTHYKCEKIREKHKGILVKYEDIKKSLMEIYKFVGLGINTNYPAFWEQRHHGLLGSKTAYSLVKKFHMKQNLWHNNYADEHGFNLNPRLGHKFLSEKDIEVFNKHGGRELNKELGYDYL